MRTFMSLAALAALSATFPAGAQPAPAGQTATRSISRVSGEIVAMTATELTVRGADGKTTAIPFPATAPLYVARPIPASAIKPGDFVATTNLNLDDKSGRAVELRVYPANSGTAAQAASYPMGQPNTTMTNAPVATVTDNPDGRTLTVRYPGGERKIVLPASVRVIGHTAIDRASLRPGWRISAILRPGPDGKLVPIQLLTGENGAAPPMR